MSSITEVKVPDIGDFKEVDVIEILVKPGDSVAKEASLITVESDKATMEIPSPVAGVVKELRVKRLTLSSFTTPATGEGISMVALSDSTVISEASLATESPGLTRISMTSTSLKSPISGTLTSVMLDMVVPFTPLPDSACSDRCRIS